VLRRPLSGLRRRTMRGGVGGSPCVVLTSWKASSCWAFRCGASICVRRDAAAGGVLSLPVIGASFGMSSVLPQVSQNREYGLAEVPQRLQKTFSISGNSSGVVFCVGEACIGDEVERSNARSRSSPHVLQNSHLDLHEVPQ